jgi:hypothetical protein
VTDYAYVTPAEFGGASGYLKQITITDDATLLKVNAVIARAQAVVDGVLELSYAEDYVNEERQVRSSRGAYFTLPPHEIGSVSQVTTMDGGDVSDYFQELPNGVLYAVDSGGYEGNWGAGMYLVTAAWGCGPVPQDVKEVTLEVAVNLWRSAEAGRFSNVIGASDGGAVGYEGALTPFQVMVLKNARRKLVPQAV